MKLETTCQDTIKGVLDSSLSEGSNNNFSIEIFKHVLGQNQLEPSLFEWCINLILNNDIDNLNDLQTYTRMIEHGHHFKRAKLVQLFLQKLHSITGNQEPEELQQDFTKIAKYKTTYKICFPIGLAVLVKSNDLALAIKLLQDGLVHEIGYWFEAELDFNAHFKRGKQNYDAKKWTILLQLLKEKQTKNSFGKNTFKIPESLDQAIKLFKEYDIYHEYLNLREDWYQNMNDRKHPISEIQPVTEFCLRYIKSNIKLDVYSFKLAPMDDLRVHPQRDIANQQIVEWGKYISREYGETSIEKFISNMDFTDWINYAYHFISDVTIIVQIQKFTVLLQFVDDIVENNVDLIDDIIAVLHTASSSGSNHVEHWTRDLNHAEEPKLKFYINQIIPLFFELGKALNTSKIFQYYMEWLNSIKNLRLAHDARAINSYEEYFSHRDIEIGTPLWTNLATSYFGQDFDSIPNHSIQTSLCRLQGIQNDIYSYGKELELQGCSSLAAKDCNNSSTMVSNVVEVGRKIYPTKSIQCIINELQQEEQKLIGDIRGLKGTDLDYWNSMSTGCTTLVACKRYSIIICKTTGLRILN